MSTNENENFQLLEQLNRVEASPFLYTRIKQKIAASSITTYSYKSLRAIAAVCFVLLLLNAFTTYTALKSNRLENLAEQYNIISQNSIYHE
ncbi:MAG: hypothetical protein IPP56_16155 [Bacteroidetes bacterium]|nr:hypothetical protein [Bacteroidota bacterium]MBK9670843.1 hypothetical protein [Bacteroidota bacterium]MBK9801181.1 hypothetical protein [Bacteroidota bacterium]MBP6411893.1 hypothetical protein [Bacteroidia bacterium]